MTTYAYDQLVLAFKMARNDIIREAAPYADDCDQQTGVDRVAEAIAEITLSEDPKFDVNRFLADVGAKP